MNELERVKENIPDPMQFQMEMKWNKSGFQKRGKYGNKPVLLFADELILCRVMGDCLACFGV